MSRSRPYMVELGSAPPGMDAYQGGLRDRVANDRDQVSDGRDGAADRRDGVALARDVAATVGGGRCTLLDVVAARSDAADDRRAAACDRRRAAEDRRASWADRATSAVERVVLSYDGLTGAYRRDTGLVEVDREIVRARRTGQPMTVAFVDVAGLKARNDRDGHAAGDRVLVAVVDALRTHLRPDDLVVRVGGDEFVCVVVDLDVGGVRGRLHKATADLADLAVSVTIGITQLEAQDTLASVIIRADDAMYAQRR
jgi:diguanylate cyclase (GGDEF)-like protein